MSSIRIPGLRRSWSACISRGSAAVANIFKYYIVYRLVAEETERRKAAKAAVNVT